MIENYLKCTIPDSTLPTEYSDCCPQCHSSNTDWLGYSYSVWCHDCEKMVIDDGSWDDLPDFKQSISSNN